ncbi:MAG: CDP-alcohol phosphatidyltransferase family protein [Chloroflexi bacterium]|nr:CDP-alcohol phosphatidyltransferase family protein [Chloroflexota bacterium]
MSAPRQSLTNSLRRLFDPLLARSAAALSRLGIAPNTLTVLGFLICLGAGGLAALGYLFWAGLIFLMGSALDALDGPLARHSGRSSLFGAFLDSTLDRYGEAALLVGLATHFATAGQPLLVFLTSLALLGSLMVSYTRARAEGLGIDNAVGLLTRLERVGLLTLTLLIGWTTLGLLALALLTQVTVAQRVLRVHQETSSS